MKKDLVLTKPITSSFLSCEKDTETILKKLFIESRPYSDTLKRLLVIPNKDALDNTTSEVYQNKVNEMSLARLIAEEYVSIKPVFKLKDHEKVKSYIHITFDDFSKDYTNPQYRDCKVRIEVMCHNDFQDLGDYRLRPFKIAGFIDGILNNCKLSGIGTLQFQNCYQSERYEDYSGYVIVYEATHGSDDQIEK